MQKQTGNGEAATPQTLDEIMAASWDQTMGEEQNYTPDEFQHLGAPNDVELPDQESEVKDEVSEETESNTDDVDTQDSDETEEESVDEQTSEETEDSEESVLADSDHWSKKAVAAPDHWSSEDKSMFAELDVGAKEFLLRRHKQMEGDYTRKTQENADAIKVGKLVDEGMDPTIKADLRRMNVDNENYVRQMMTWHTRSVQDPAGFLRDMAQQLNLDPAQVFDGTESKASQEAQDPMSQRMAAIESHLNSEQQQRMASIVQQQENRVKEFSEQKDEAGNLVHPHFDKVRKDMAMMVRTDPSMSLEDAYNVSVYKDPELRQSLMGSSGNPSGPSKTERTNKALRAKESNIKAKRPSSVSKMEEDKPMSLQDAMKSAAEEVGLN